MFKKIKRSANDATAPIIKPCYVDVNAIWNKKKSTSVSDDLSERVLKTLAAKG